jgi:hypothetical protein
LAEENKFQNVNQPSAEPDSTPKVTAGSHSRHKKAPSTSKGEIYSQAFEQYVDSNDDVIGLIAYGSYEMSKVDWTKPAPRGLGKAEAKCRFMSGPMIA